MRAANRRAVLFGLCATAVTAGTLGTSQAMDYSDPDTMYAALRNRPRQTITIGGGSIAVVFADRFAEPARLAILRWVRRAALAVTAYYGRFPVRNYAILIVAEPGSRVGHATTFGYDGAATRIGVGLDAGSDAFDRDWVLVHEMVHTAMPDLPRRALWLQEGNATYVEPIARALAGQLPAADVWREAIDGMPRGLPQATDAGMDGTNAWGRLYWGGAIFWLQAEIAIYRDSAGTRSLREALRHINRASSGNVANWDPELLMATGDAALGSDTLGRLYHRFATSRMTVDLASVFADLGIADDGEGHITFDDRAALAGLRRSITL